MIGERLPPLLFRPAVDGEAQGADGRHRHHPQRPAPRRLGPELAQRFERGHFQLQVLGLIARAKLLVRAEDAVDDESLIRVVMRQKFQVGVADDVEGD